MSISRRTSDECFLAIYKLPILIDRDLYGLTKPVELHWETRLFLRIVMIESRTVCLICSLSLSLSLSLSVMLCLNYFLLFPFSKHFYFLEEFVDYPN